MLSITVLEEEYTRQTPDGETEFITVGGYNLELEHSLVALSKWESKYKKPFLAEDKKTPEEIYDYIKFMAVHPGVPEYVFQALDESHLRAINEYLNDTQTATWFNEPKIAPKTSSETITSELLYYWIAGFGFPIELQYWHLNRLLTALKVAHIKSQPPKKKSQSEIYAEMRRKNEERRKRYESN